MRTADLRALPFGAVALLAWLAAACNADSAGSTDGAAQLWDAASNPAQAAAPLAEAGIDAAPSGAASPSAMDASGSFNDDAGGTTTIGLDAGTAGRVEAGIRDAAPVPNDALVVDAAPIDPSIKFVGNITTRGQVRSDFVSMWNQISPENEGKWESVEATRDRMDWSGLDRIYAYAKQNGVIFKQHTFVWGNQQPRWLNGLAAAEQAEEVEEWIKLFCERYPDVAQIDVVNEPPPHTTPVYMNALGGAGASGYDWIVQAFKLSRKYCPKAILILNDYNTIEYSADNTRFISIAKAVKQAGAPIDAVGAQAHATGGMTTANVQQMLDKLANDTGLPVYITEFDLDLADNNRQRQVMESHFTMFWRHPKVKGITLWGYVSGSTWVPNSGLMSESGTPRPALTWLLNFLKAERQ
jgi:endo-1,4-beta-xylanase